MKNLGIILFCILFVVLACDFNEVKDLDKTGKSDKPYAYAYKYSLSGYVRNLESTEIYLSQAQVRIGDVQVQTDSKGFFTLDYNNREECIEISFPDFVTLYKPLSDYGSDEMSNINFFLKPVDKDEMINPTLLNHIKTDDGAGIKIPVLEKIQEMLKINITNFDVSGIDLMSIPGDFSALDSLGISRLLLSYGIIHLDISINKLLLSAGNYEFEITIPITGKIANAPELIPLWYFDINKGLWIEEGVARKVGENYVGLVKRLSLWSAGTATEKTICLTGNIKDFMSVKDKVYRISFETPRTGFSRFYFQESSNKNIRIEQVPVGEVIILTISGEDGRELMKISRAIPENYSKSCYDFGSLEFIDKDSVEIIEDESGLLYYEYDSYVTVKAYTGTNTTLVIPDSYKEKMVLEIESKAFENNTSLISVVLPAGLTSIGMSAFQGCTNLRSVKFPENLMSISDFAFAMCTGLESLSFPEKLLSINKFAFYMCMGLESIEFNKSLVSIRESAFYFCSNLKTVTLPENLSQVGKSSFSFCTSVTSVVFPEDLTSIDDSSFSFCSSLVSIDFPKKLVSIGSEAFKSCDKLSSLNFPEGLTLIGEKAFEFCSGLITLYLPESLISIGNSSFSGCTGLSSLSLPSKLMTLGASAFSDCISIISIRLPENLNSLGDSVFSGCIGLSILECLNPVPPALIGDFISDSINSQLKIHVPDKSVDDYKSAPQWTLHKNKISAI